MQGLIEIATRDGADVTTQMKEMVAWLMSSKQFKGTIFALLTDGIMLEANGRYFIVETPNGTVNKCIKVEHGAGAITIDDSDSEADPEGESDAAPAAAAPSLRQMAFDPEASPQGGPPRSTPRGAPAAGSFRRRLRSSGDLRLRMQRRHGGRPAGASPRQDDCV